MKPFILRRFVDVSGISGIGVVARGLQFPTGRVVVEWCVPNKPPSIGVWDSIADLLEIHGHDGTTRVEWIEWEEA